MDGSADRCDRYALMDEDVTLFEVAVVHDYSVRLLPAKTGPHWDSEVDSLGIRVQDAIYAKCCQMRYGDILGSPICFRPEDGLLVLRELAGREIWDAIDAASGSFETAPLCKASQDRIGKARPPGLLSSHESVVLFGEAHEFIEA